MSKIIIDKNICLAIGSFFIYITNSCRTNQLITLPEEAEVFIEEHGVREKGTVYTYNIAIDNTREQLQGEFITGLYSGPNPFDIHRADNGDYLWRRIDRDGSTRLLYRISRDWSSWRLLEDRSEDNGETSFSELVYIFSYSILTKKAIIFHGVVMEWEGMGIIVCAHSGVGKTTHTRMWRDQEGALILNGDRALCYQEDGMWYTAGAPWSGSSGEQLNRSVKLNAVVVLEQAKENKITNLSPLSGALELMQLTFAPSWEEDLANHSLETIDHLVSEIPVFKLSCQPDLEAVEVLKHELSKLQINHNNLRNDLIRNLV